MYTSTGLEKLQALLKIVYLVNHLHWCITNLLDQNAPQFLFPSVPKQALLGPVLLVFRHSLSYRA